MTTTKSVGDCPYRADCLDNGVMCATCVNNPKRSYFRPVEPYYIPYYPCVPYYPYWQPLVPWCQTSTTESHYQT